MRRWLLLAALLLSALAPLGGHRARALSPPAYVPVGPGDTYLALGDSLSTGDEAAANNDGLPGYPAGLSQIIRATSPISFTNLGVSGETSASMRSPGGQLDRAVAYIGAQRAAGRVVSPVTLDIGGNDMVGVFLGTGGKTITDTLPIFRANLATILDSLLGALTVGGQRRGDLILMNYYNPYPGQTIYDSPFTNLPDGQGPIVTDLEVPKFNQVLAEEAAARGIPLVDAYSAFAGREPELIYVRFPILLFPFDANNFDYHPRPDGHALLARGFADASGYRLPRAYLPLVVR